MVKRARKRPVTAVAPADSQGTRRIPNTQQRISVYHTLLKQMETATPETAARLQLEIDAMGGLHAYQKASLKGGHERSGKGACAKYLMEFLRPQLQATATDRRFSILDVGSLTGASYANYSWVDGTYSMC